MAKKPVDTYVEIISHVIQLNYRHFDYDQFIQYMDKLKKIHPVLANLTVNKGFVIRAALPDGPESYRALEILMNYIYGHLSSELGAAKAKEKVVSVAEKSVRKNRDALLSINFERYFPAPLRPEITNALYGTGKGEKIDGLKSKLLSIPEREGLKEWKPIETEAKKPTTSHIYESRVSGGKEEKEAGAGDRLTRLKDKLKMLEDRHKISFPEKREKKPVSAVKKPVTAVKKPVTAVKKPVSAVKKPVKTPSKPPKKKPSREWKEKMEKRKKPERLADKYRGDMIPPPSRRRVDLTPPKWVFPALLVVIILFGAVIHFGYSAPGPAGTGTVFHTPEMFPSSKITDEDTVHLHGETGAAALVEIFVQGLDESGNWVESKRGEVEAGENGAFTASVPLTPGLNRIYVRATSSGSRVLESTIREVVKVGTEDRAISLTAYRGGTSSTAPVLSLYADRILIHDFVIDAASPRIFEASWPLTTGMHNLALYYRNSGSTENEPVTLVNLEVDNSGTVFAGGNNGARHIDAASPDQMFESVPSGGSQLPSMATMGSGAVFSRMEVSPPSSDTHVLTIRARCIDGSGANTEFWVDGSYAGEIPVAGQSFSNYTLGNLLLLDSGRHSITVMVNTGLIGQWQPGSGLEIEKISIDGDQPELSPLNMIFDQGEGADAWDGVDTGEGTETLTAAGSLKGTFII